MKKSHAQTDLFLQESNQLKDALNQKMTQFEVGLMSKIVLNTLNHKRELTKTHDIPFMKKSVWKSFESEYLKLETKQQGLYNELFKI